MKNNKKSISQMAFVIVAFVLALIFLVVMSFISGSVVNDWLKSVGAIKGQIDEETGCLVLTGGINDKDGDGLHDTKLKPDKTKCDPDPPPTR
ncbi:hypothetical protein CMO93_03280 [Candidatus Woesearchaeota archaeon]|nr:hypothetical protein [Candidatus Woesearchaeota archaeon]|tara:strand:- start:785 stop:1060 length:276 start_codon:yes stop_codon:yes gene_type:complete